MVAYACDHYATATGLSTHTADSQHASIPESSGSEARSSRTNARHGSTPDPVRLSAPSCPLAARGLEAGQDADVPALHGGEPAATQ